jgi:hypothetical protein
MVDRSILIRVLDILCRLDGISLAEHVLLDEVSLRTAHPCTSDEVRDSIAHAKDHGWVARETGLVGEIRWKRTLAGKAALEDLKNP